MNAYAKAFEIRKQQRTAINAKIGDAVRHLSPKKADMIMNLGTGKDKVDVNRRAHVKAIELVSDLMAQFSLSSKPQLEYRGVIKNASDQHGVIEDGIVRIGAILRTVLGHKISVDIPVIIKNKTLLEPSLFFYDGAPYVMCAPAFDDLIKYGTLEKDVLPRSMYGPPIEHPEYEMPRVPITNKENMYSPGPIVPYSLKRVHGEHKGKPRKRTNIDTPTEMPKLWEDYSDQMLDPACRDTSNFLWSGAKVTAKDSIEVRERGGGTIIVPKGESGIVLRDMANDGLMMYVEFPDLCLSAAVPARMLKSADVNVSQVKNEVRQMLREGYQKVDIKEAVQRLYPEQAAEVLQGLE